MIDQPDHPQPKTLEEMLRRRGQLQRELDRLDTEIQRTDKSVMNRTRGCKTPGCPGHGKVWKRRNRIDYVHRRIECPLCELRWSSTERFQLVSIAQTGPHSLESAIRRLAALKAKQHSSSSPQVIPVA